jgi:hypothetical protein
MATKKDTADKSHSAMVEELDALPGVTTTGGLPPRITIYGPPKIGKSSFGAMADSPIFQQAEDGLDALKVPAFPKLESFSDAMKNLENLATKKHNYKTIVTDSADHLEPLIWKETAASENLKSIEDFGYGKGYIKALDLWREYFEAIDYLRSERGMTSVMIAHHQIKRFESPVTDAYDKYEIKLHKNASALLIENSDIILFANYFVGIKKEADSSRQKDDDKRKRAIGSGERILYTEERPAFSAGNRYGLPSEIPFDKDGSYWGVIADHVPFFNANK